MLFYTFYLNICTVCTRDSATACFIFTLFPSPYYVTLNFDVFIKAPENLLDGGVENLLDYLRLPHFTTQLQLLRAIYSWLGNQELVETVYDRDDVAVDSLYSFLKSVTKKQVDVCQLFQYICL